MNHYATYFDSHYLPRARVLFASLDRHDPDWRATVLALDEGCERALRALGRRNLAIVSLAQLEADEPRLAGPKAERSRVEYYFTLGPSFLDLCFRLEPALEALTYVDADLCFFSSPSPLYAELAGASVGLVEHRFSPRNAKSLEAGTYNVGWLYFRGDADGRAALAWWKERCLEWCFDRLEDGKYADQKYLESMPGLFQGVRSLAHPGVNVAPWNVDGLRIRRGAGGVEVEGRPLIAYHVHGLKQLGPRRYRALGADYGARYWGALRQGVYLPYLTELQALAPSEVAGQLRYAAQPFSPWGALRALKHGLFHGSYFVRAFGRFW